MFALSARSLRVCVRSLSTLPSKSSYVQGQSPSPRIREYFYYIDHQGQLFLDDTKVKNFITCFKDRQFLKFFFKRIKQNNTPRYSQEFPYISPCGVEKNYVRCDDVPFVFSTLIEGDENSPFGLLTCNGMAEAYTFPFQPEKICMLPESGRIYHPGPEKAGGIGLIKSSLAFELSANIEYRQRNQETDPPTHFHWMTKTFELDNSLWDVIRSDEVNRLREKEQVS